MVRQGRWPHGRPAGRRPRHARRRVPVDRRPLGVRQVHPAAHRRRPRRAVGGQRQGQGPQRPAGQGEPGPRRGLPDPGAVRVAVGRPQRPAPPGGDGLRCRRAQAARAADAGAGRPAGVREARGVAALRRYAAAGLDRQGAVVRPLAAAHGRAVRGAGRDHPRPDEHGAPAHLDGDRHQRPVHHALDRRGGVPLRSGAGDELASRLDRLPLRHPPAEASHRGHPRAGRLLPPDRRDPWPSAQPRRGARVNGESRGGRPQMRAPFARARALWTAGAVFVVLALVATACGSDNGGGGAGGQPSAPAKIRVQLSWIPDGQFAGYLMARDKGFYKAENLDVTLLPGGPNVNAVQQVVTGAAEMTINKVSELYAARDMHLPVISIAQFDQRSSFPLVAFKSTGINGPKDFKGKKVGIWYGGNEYEGFALMRKVGLDPKKDVQLFEQGFTMDSFLKHEYQVAMVTTFNELNVIRLSGVKDDQLTIVNPSDYGISIPHGALIANQRWLDRDGDKHAATQDLTQLQTMSINAIKELQYPAGFPRDQHGKIDPALYQNVANIVKEFGYVKKDLDVTAAYDPSIWQAATSGAK